mgnify:CR=1 FL=1
MNSNIELSYNCNEPYDIEDISNVKIDMSFEESIAHLNECIICKLTDIESFEEDLSKNMFCLCNFYYHDSCYREWIQYKKSNKCLICDKDISCNYYTEPPDEHADEPMVLSYRERQLLRRQQILHREISCWDTGFNMICCIHPISRRNPYITGLLLQEKTWCCCFTCIIASALLTALAFILYWSIKYPQAFIM